MEVILNRHQLVKKGMYSYKGKFFSLRVDSILEGQRRPGKQTGSQKVVFLRKYENKKILNVHLLHPYVDMLEKISLILIFQL